jgi:hypothetical protein
MKSVVNATAHAIRAKIAERSSPFAIKKAKGSTRSRRRAVSALAIDGPGHGGIVHGIESNLWILSEGYIRDLEALCTIESFACVPKKIALSHAKGRPLSLQLLVG